MSVLGSFLSDPADLQKLFKFSLGSLQLIAIEIVKKRPETRDECVMALFEFMKGHNRDSVMMVVRLAHKREQMLIDLTTMINSDGSLQDLTTKCSRPYDVMKLVQKHYPNFHAVDYKELYSRVYDGLD